MAKRPTKVAKIGFGRISFQGSNPDVTKMLRSALTRGTRTEFYRRTWTLGPSRKQENTILGTVGVESGDGGTVDLWDPKSEDFVRQTVPEGIKTPWAINLTTLRIGFQLRPGIDKRQGFCGAFQKLMNEAAGFPGWLVKPEVEPVEFEAWVDSLDRLERLSVRIDRPNPHYADRDEVESIIEQTHAKKVRIAAEARDGESLDPEGDEFLAEAIDHAEAGYGEVSGRGHIGAATSRFNSRNNQAPPDVEIPADAETGDAHGPSLRQAVGGTEVEDDAVQDAGLDQEDDT